MNYKKIIYGCIAIFLVIMAYYSFREWSNRFDLRNITFQGTLPYIPHLKTSQTDISAIKSLLNQEFLYLGQGNQSYAFESADRQYVIKFFKFNHLKPSFFDDEKSSTRRLKKLKRIFSSHELAYNEDSEQSGIIYMQLTPDGSFNQTVQLRDRMGFQHAIDLSKVIFVLQYKAIPTRQLLAEFAAKNNSDATIAHLNLLLDLYIADYKRGIMDDDHNIMYNTGFYNGKPIRIDIGKLVKNPELHNADVFMKDLHKIVYHRINKWLNSHDPNHEIVMEALHKKIN